MSSPFAPNTRCAWLQPPSIFRDKLGWSVPTYLAAWGTATASCFKADLCIIISNGSKFTERRRYYSILWTAPVRKHCSPVAEIGGIYCIFWFSAIVAALNCSSVWITHIWIIWFHTYEENLIHLIKKCVGRLKKTGAFVNSHKYKIALLPKTTTFPVWIFTLIQNQYKHPRKSDILWHIVRQLWIITQQTGAQWLKEAHSWTQPVKLIQSYTSRFLTTQQQTTHTDISTVHIHIAWLSVLHNRL